MRISILGKTIIGREKSSFNFLLLFKYTILLDKKSTLIFLSIFYLLIRGNSMSSKID